MFSPLPNIPTRRWGPPRFPFHGEYGSFPRVMPRLKNSSYIRVSPAFTAKTDKMAFVFLFKAAISTLIDRKIVVELRNKSSKILLMNSGGGAVMIFLLLATFRHLFPEEANLHAVEWQDFHKEII
jgi:hypothetical protein